MKITTVLGVVWGSTALAVMTAVVVTNSAIPLWFMLIPATMKFSEENN